MDFLKIFLLGGASGVIFSIISMILLSARNSEKYPVGGFIPALWLITDLGFSSQIIVAGVLIMGGMTGFYLTLTFWKERQLLSKNKNKIDLDINNSKETIPASENIIIVKGKSLAEFL